MRPLGKYLLGVALLSLSFVGMGLAQLPPNVPFKWWTNLRVVRELGLTPDQINRIDTIWRDYRKPLIDLRAEHPQRQADLHSGKRDQHAGRAGHHHCQLG